MPSDTIGMSTLLLLTWYISTDMYGSPKAYSYYKSRCGTEWVVFFYPLFKYMPRATSYIVVGGLPHLDNCTKPRYSIWGEQAVKWNRWRAAAMWSVDLIKTSIYFNFTIRGIFGRLFLFPYFHLHSQCIDIETLICNGSAHRMDEIYLWIWMAWLPWYPDILVSWYYVSWYPWTRRTSLRCQRTCFCYIFVLHLHRCSWSNPGIWCASNIDQRQRIIQRDSSQYIR